MDRVQRHSAACCPLLVLQPTRNRLTHLLHLDKNCNAQANAEWRLLTRAAVRLVSLERQFCPTTPRVAIGKSDPLWTLGGHFCLPRCRPAAIPFLEACEWPIGECLVRSRDLELAAVRAASNRKHPRFGQVSRRFCHGLTLGARHERRFYPSR